MNPLPSKQMRVLLVDTGSDVPSGTRELLTAGGYGIAVTTGYDSALRRTKEGQFDAAILPAPAEEGAAAAQPFHDLIRACEVQGTAAIVLGEYQADLQTGDGHIVEFAAPPVTKEEIKGRLAMLLHYHRVVRAMERDLDNMQRLFRQLNVRFAEVDQEMRLAGRLQSSFLPRELKDIGSLSFAALYRPATFVSGDIYDIFRVDEDHVAFYVADAVGHGMAASLLTMFIKNAVVAKLIHDEGYEVLDPNATLQRLNCKLVDQHLPNSQFVTACYGLINTRTLELQYARAGHPYPLHVAPDGGIAELKSPGGLLGLFEDEEFPTHRLVLQPGEKIILYSDGLELAFAESEDRADEMNFYREAIRKLSDLRAQRLVNEFAKMLDNEAGSLNPQDDVTLLVMQVNG